MPHKYTNYITSTPKKNYGSSLDEAQRKGHQGGSREGKDTKRTAKRAQQRWVQGIPSAHSPEEEERARVMLTKLTLLQLVGGAASGALAMQNQGTPPRVSGDVRNPGQVPSIVTNQSSRPQEESASTSGASSGATAAIVGALTFGATRSPWAAALSAAAAYGGGTVARPNYSLNIPKDYSIEPPHAADPAFVNPAGSRSAHFGDEMIDRVANSYIGPGRAPNQREFKLPFEDFVGEKNKNKHEAASKALDFFFATFKLELITPVAELSKAKGASKPAMWRLRYRPTASNGLRHWRPHYGETGNWIGMLTIIVQKMCEIANMEVKENAAIVAEYAQKACTVAVDVLEGFDRNVHEVQNDVILCSKLRWGRRAEAIWREFQGSYKLINSATDYLDRKYNDSEPIEKVRWRNYDAVGCRESGVLPDFTEKDWTRLREAIAYSSANEVLQSVAVQSAESLRALFSADTNATAGSEFIAQVGGQLSAAAERHAKEWAEKVAGGFHYISWWEDFDGFIRSWRQTALKDIWESTWESFRDEAIKIITSVITDAEEEEQWEAEGSAPSQAQSSGPTSEASRPYQTATPDLFDFERFATTVPEPDGQQSVRVKNCLDVQIAVYPDAHFVTFEMGGDPIGSGDVIILAPGESATIDALAKDGDWEGASFRLYVSLPSRDGLTMYVNPGYRENVYDVGVRAPEREGVMAEVYNFGSSRARQFTGKATSRGYTFERVRLAMDVKPGVKYDSKNERVAEVERHEQAQDADPIAKLVEEGLKLFNW